MGVKLPSMKLLVHLFVMIAMVTAGISPACAFIGGRMHQIEICKADGSVEIISVPADQAPDNGQQDQHHQLSADDCSFCALSAYGKALKSAAAAIPSPLLRHDALATEAITFTRPATLSSFDATGPPSYVA